MHVEVSVSLSPLFEIYTESPTIACPYVGKNHSDTISFAGPVIKSFPSEGLVFISYYLQNGDRKGLFPANVSQHTLHGFNVGTTVVTVNASSHNTSATCEFTYYRTPGRLCNHLIE